MSETLAPVLYLPHGGGPMPLLGDRAHTSLIKFLKEIPGDFSLPAAIVLISAHWEEPVVTINSGEAPGMLFDYGGFPPETYQYNYPAPGSPALALQILEKLTEAGLSVDLDPERGFDHGVFVPMMLMYPQADIPCIQLSLVRGLDPELHIRIGRALADLRKQNIMIVGSGMSFHNLQALFAGPHEELREASDGFNQWLVDTCTNVTTSVQDKTRSLTRWEQAPHARFCHPREEHLLPLHVCFGAGSVNSSVATLVYNDAIMNHRVAGLLW